MMAQQTIRVRLLPNMVRELSRFYSLMVNRQQRLIVVLLLVEGKLLSFLTRMISSILKP